MAVPRCGRAPVSFLPQLMRFPVDFWATVPCQPNRRHAAAIRPPQTGPAEGLPGHEALARIELNPLGRPARQSPEFSMFSVFVPSESSLKKAAAVDLAALPENAV